MAVQTLTIPGRSYPVGTTMGQLALPSTQRYSHADVTVDFTGWTDPATTRIAVSVDYSEDGGASWRNMVAFTQTSPPPYAAKNGGTTNSTTVRWDTPAALDPTHIRGAVSVEGAAVTLGTITINAS